MHGHIICTLDIETLPDLREGAKERIRATMKVPATHKKPETIEAWKDENAEDAWRKTSFDGGYGAICVIGYKFDDELPKTIQCHNEREGLEEFFSALNDTLPTPWAPGIEFVGHNLLGFDLPFLWKRAVIHRLPHRKIPKDARHESGRVFDTMIAWAGFKDRVSLDSLAGMLGLNSHKGDMDGSMVCDAWLAGRYDDVAEYCAKDVALTYEIYKRLTT